MNSKKKNHIFEMQIHETSVPRSWRTFY